MSLVEESLEYTGLFEAELLVELMLRYWKHPLADNSGFRNQLLESAVEVLHHSISGTVLIEGLEAENMNLVAAVWYSEWVTLEGSREPEEVSRSARHEWLGKVRKSVPSCFCDPELLE